MRDGRAGSENDAMAEHPVLVRARQARERLAGLGIKYSVGTSWNDRGEPVVVVDIPLGVDRQSVMNRLAELGTDIVVRHITRSIIAH